MVKQESSSSNEEEDHHESSSDDEEDGELALMMRKFTRLSDKINKKGYNFDPKRRMFQYREDVKYKTRERRTTKANIAMIQAMMKRMRRKTRTRSLGRRRAMTRRQSSSQRKRAIPREAYWWKSKSG